jgi:hypothetical protein
MDGKGCCDESMATQIRAACGCKTLTSEGRDALFRRNPTLSNAET